MPVVTIFRAINDVAPTRGLDVVHRAISDARARGLLREDELALLAARYGERILERYVE